MRHTGQQQGFTLIELMVVLVIIGIASAAVGLSIRPDPLKTLRADAEGLAQQLQVAQAEAHADGRPITWQASAKGHAFSRHEDNGNRLEDFRHDRQLRPRLWQSPALQVHIEPAQRLVLNAEWINPPLRVALSDGQNSVRVERSASGQWRVVSQP